MAIEQTQQTIRSVVINVNNGSLLLPNGILAEVISASEPQPVEGAPDWFLGRIRWRGWSLPQISFAQLAGMADEDNSRKVGQKVAILKALSPDAVVPYMAVLTQGFPRLTIVDRDFLVGVALEEDEEREQGVLTRAMLRDDEVIIPNMREIDQLIADVLSVEHEVESV